MGVSRDDDVDAVYGLGQFIVLALAIAGAAMGQADHHGVDTVLGFALGHGCLDGGGGLGGGILKDHARIGGAGIGIKAEYAEEDVVYASPLQNGVVFDTVGVVGFPQLGIVALLTLNGGQVVGAENGGQRVTAGHGGVQHTLEAGLEIIVFMVAEGGGVIAQGAHHAKLDGRGGVGGLEQRAHGEVAAVHQNGVGVNFLLRLDGGHEAGITTVLAAACLIGRGKEVGMEIMGKEDGDLVFFGGLGGPGKDAERQDGQKNKEDGQESFDGVHGFVLSQVDLVCLKNYYII